MTADLTLGAIEYALQGLARRADVRADNVANMNTPGFRAGRVDFESTLRAAIATGDPGRAAPPAVRADRTVPGPSGSTVDLENELVGMMKDNLLRDAMVNSYNAKVGMLRAAIAGR